MVAMGRVGWQVARVHLRRMKCGFEIRFFGFGEQKEASQPLELLACSHWGSRHYAIDCLDCHCFACLAEKCEKAVELRSTGMAKRCDQGWK